MAKPVDLWAVAFDQNDSKVTVELQDGTQREFLIRAENKLFMPHYREAIAFCGFGSKGLSNFIYAEALDFARSHDLKNDEIEVQLSQGCATGGSSCSTYSDRRLPKSFLGQSTRPRRP